MWCSTRRTDRSRERRLPRRSFKENVRGHLRFFAKHYGAREAERARRLMLWALRLRAGCSAASAAACTATPHRGSHPLSAAARRRASLTSHVTHPLAVGARAARARARTRLSGDGRRAHVRLSTATLCLLLPGALVSRALGQQSVFAALSWSLAGLTAASAVMFAVEGPLWWALVLYAGAGAVALLFAIWRPLRLPSPFAIGVALAGVGFGIALWSIAGQLDGDALFHLARIRKLEAFRQSHARVRQRVRGRRAAPRLCVPPVARAHGGGLARGVDSAAAVLHEPSVLVPVAFLVAYEAGVAILRTAWAGSLRCSRPR